MEVFLIKEPSLLREGMIRILEEKFTDFSVTAYNADEFSSHTCCKSKPDLVILDINSKINIEPTINYYKTNDKKVIVWASNPEDNTLIDLFKLDLNGYFFDEMDKEELMAAIQSVIDGKKYIHEELTPVLLGDYVKLNQHTRMRAAVEEISTESLSQREWEVLELLTQGCKNEQIAKLMFISEKTVKNHVSNILKKLAVPDRTNAVLKALRNRWFTV